MTGAAWVLPGCRLCRPQGGPKPGLALQLYSIRDYIDRVGLAKALRDVSALGYRGVEFAGYYEASARDLKAMLADAGLVPVGTHVSRQDFTNKNYERNVEFELAYGNTLMISPLSGNLPVRSELIQSEERVELNVKQEDSTKRIVDLYNQAAEKCGRLGMRIGLHNHRWEHRLVFRDGTTYWDYFFTNTDPRVQMEQDVGWSLCAGVDPLAQYVKYPHRSATLHAKENGGLNVPGSTFEGILGETGSASVKGIDWDGLIATAKADGIGWFVVECEYHADDFRAIGPSAEFLKAKGVS